MEERTTTVRREADAVEERPVARTTDPAVVDDRRVVSSQTVLARVIWFITGVIVVLLAIRVVLLLLGANQGNPFVDFIYGLSGIFAWPFYGIFSYQPSYGISTLEVSSLVAIVIYALVGWGIARLLTLNRPTPGV